VVPRALRRPCALDHPRIALAAVPASVVAVTIVQWRWRVCCLHDLCRSSTSRRRSRRRANAGRDPTLLGRAEDVAGMLRQIELHYLSNPIHDSSSPCSPTTWTPIPCRMQARCSRARHRASLRSMPGTVGKAPVLFTLASRIALESKRGALHGLGAQARQDRGAQSPPSRKQEHELRAPRRRPAKLDGIRFVVTLDSDTELPIGSVHRMIGLLSHPLNRPVFDAETGRVVSGYTIAQPRIETSASSARHTRFSKIFSGDVGFDIYTHALPIFIRPLWLRDLRRQGHLRRRCVPPEFG